MTKTMKLKVYSPVPAVEAIAPVARVAEGSTNVIGIVDDNLDPPFMEELAEQLRQHLPGSTVRVWTKPTGTAPAPDSLIEEMAKEVQIALAGIGM